MLFDEYSRRARSVIFLARTGAGQRGAGAIEIGDLLMALLSEDQGQTRNRIFGPSATSSPTAGVGPWPHAPVLASELAKGLQDAVESLLSRSRPAPKSQEMPVSPAVHRVLETACDLRVELGEDRVQPVHLLAAAVEDGSDACAELFRRAGVTRRSVLHADKEARTPLGGEGPLAGDLTADGLRRFCSQRALDVLFLARVKATTRGSKEVEVEDALASLLIEDQGDLERVVFESPAVGIARDGPPVPRPSHQAFLPPDLARRLLARVEALSARSKPLATHLRFSADVKRCVAVAEGMRSQLGQSTIEPLHLLAAILTLRPTPSAEILREAGIDRERILKAIQEELT